MRAKLVLCALIPSEALAQSLNKQLGKSIAFTSDRFALHWFKSVQEYLSFISAQTTQIDCLLLQDNPELPALLQNLHDQLLLLPVVVLQDPSTPNHLSDYQQYHNAVQQLPTTELNCVDKAIEEAISKFLNLYASGQLVNLDQTTSSIAALTTHSSLMQQQQRLAEKLKERLGYLGVYYKRNPAHFYRHMDQDERQELLNQLKDEYRQIVLDYFPNQPGLNDRIDNFVNLAFFADVSVAQVMEIHMELMDEFSKQLKLEGRSDDILMDYRLTLIDTIAHLCEMYRRSIPRES